MRYLFSLLTLTFLFTSCNDGDIITAQLDFPDTFKVCGDLVCYKTKTDPNESLSAQMSITLDELLTTEVDADNPLLVNLVTEESSKTISSFNYRTYNNAPENLFCNDIPPSNISIIEDYTSTSSQGNFTITLTEDDNDGIPAEYEDLNNNGNYDDDDTDNDGLPNYLDPDDDGDNVLTATEMPNFSTDLLLSTALDTDLDGTPNYLDTDDDNDGVLTINEESQTANQNPADDITTSALGPDYLNDAVTNDVPATAYREHIISQEFNVALTITNINLSILTQDTLYFGLLDDADTSKSRNVTPTF